MIQLIAKVKSHLIVCLSFWSCSKLSYNKLDCSINFETFINLIENTQIK